MIDDPLNQLWLLVCACLVLVMQAGFLCRTAGLARGKKAVSIALPSMVAAAVAPLLFVPVGSILMLGSSPHTATDARALLLFHTAVSATVATIVAGAAAGRMRFGPGVAVSVLLGGLIYPLVGQGVWGRTGTDAPGWLQAFGFADYAGAGVVHVTTGFAALAIVLASRHGLSSSPGDRHGSDFPHHGLPIALLGALLLNVGWMGFNAGPKLRFDDQVPLILLNTLLAACSGAAVAAAVAVPSRRRLKAQSVINGMLSGLVASCAVADVCEPLGSALLGGIAAAASLTATTALKRFRVKDALAVFPVHGVGGLLGLLVRPCFDRLTFGDPIGGIAIQAFGAAAIGALAFFPTYVLAVAAGSLAGRRTSNTSPPTDEAPAASTASPEPPALEATNDSRFLQMVLDGIDTQVCILDADGMIVEVNAAWRRFVEGAGVRVEGAIGSSFDAMCTSARVYTGDDPNEPSAAATAIAAGRSSSFRGEFTALVGEQTRSLDVSLKRLADPGRGAVLVMQVDRTEEREAQRLTRLEKDRAEKLAGALAASQSSLDLAMNGGNLGMWYWDVATDYFELSGSWMESLGLRAADLDADLVEFRKRLHPDEAIFWTVEDSMSLAEDEPYDRQFRVRDSDGEYRWVQALGRANSVGPDGAPETISGVFIDITERKEGELRAAGMAQIIEDSYNEVYITDARTQQFIEVNRGARENLGYTLDELRTMVAADLLPEYEDGAWRDFLRPILTGEAPRVEVESVHRRRDDSTYPILFSLQRARLMERDVIVAIGVDLTQRRQLEAQLAEAQRLESIGSLAAGVAHEMNTPLQYVSNNMQFLRDCTKALFEVLDAHDAALDPSGPAASWQERRDAAIAVAERSGFSRIRAEFPGAIAESMEGVDRVLQIVRAMKEFSHPGTTHKTLVDVNNAITGTTTVTRSRWKEAAELALELDPDLPAVECQGGSINQVFVNLIVNAADAIADRRNSDPNAPAGKIVVRSSVEGANAVFEVEDNGSGMPEDVKRRAFEQFFTTKEVGRGTGQGLSLCHAIVTRNHGGQIEIDSAAGEGTTIRIRMPIAAELDGEAQDATVAVQPLQASY